MRTGAVICEVRYRLDPTKLQEFQEYAATWIRLIERHGGVHYGFFLPRGAPAEAQMSFPGQGRPGRDDEAIALFGFADDAAYEDYRLEVLQDPEGAAAIERFADPPFLSYERIFLQPVPRQLQQNDP